MLPSDNSDDGRGRVRAETYPPRPSPCFPENKFQSDRDAWLTNAMSSGRSWSPSGGVLSPLKKTFEYGFGGGLFLQKKRAHGGSGEALSSSGSWPRMKSTRTSPAPTSCESGGSATSHSEATSRGTPRAPRRRHHHHRKGGGWGKEVGPLPTTRQQRLVTSMFVLVVVLGSIQIFALIVHPPTGRNFALGGLSGIAGSGGGSGGGGGDNNNNSNGVRRRASGGFRDKLFGASSGGSDGSGGGVTQASAGGLRGGVLNNNESVQQQQHGLSLSNPRAFEMVAADMGNLKDTVSYHYSNLHCRPKRYSSNTTPKPAL